MKPFSASNISLLLTGGKTAMSYCLDLCIQDLGIKDDFDTKEMAHGRNNQLNAFELCIKPKYPNAIWFDSFLRINDHLGASPDIVDGNAPIEIKCPYYFDTFLEQINQPPKRYWQQVQCQMMALNSDIGYLCFYLTAPEIWGSDEWKEYPIDLSQRHKIFEYKKDEETQENILKAVEEYQPKKASLLDNLKNALEMEFEQFFYLQFEGYAFRKLKTASNIFNVDEIFRVGNEFYYLKK